MYDEKINDLAIRYRELMVAYNYFESEWYKPAIQEVRSSLYHEARIVYSKMIREHSKENENDQL